MTFRRILVALDGSRLADAVLPAACTIAATLGARVILLHVLERDPPETVHGEPHLASAAAARERLERHAHALAARGIEVEVDVHARPVSDVAAAIDAHAHELRADLIALCAHGRTNLRTRVLGSIAERILRGGSTPVLLRTVRRPDAVGFALRNVLVPVDFSHDVELALEATRALAGPCEARVTLLSALQPGTPPTERLVPSAAAVARELERAELERRLAGLADALRGDAADVRTVVDDRRPAEAILAAAGALPADLIVLVTDAHGRLSRAYEPSTAQQLLGRPDLTLLLIREL